jgi:hypothetical protein
MSNFRAALICANCFTRWLSMAALLHRHHDSPVGMPVYDALLHQGMYSPADRVVSKERGSGFAIRRRAA